MTTTPRRSVHIDKAVTAALRDINVIDSAIAALDYATGVVDSHTRTDRDGARAEAHAMRHSLYLKRNEALTRAMQFGHLTTNDDLRREAFKQATQYLTNKYTSIMQYLEVDGIAPGSWATALDEEFRAEIIAAYAETQGVNA